jgi:hypothetical protein
MKKDCIDMFLGKYCKIITKESDGEKTHAISGLISDFDQDDESIVIDSNRGIFYLKIDTILSITPRERLRGNR